ncbi:MAG: class I SAM-dependent DNA methyltransferase [Planctomycetota bacterium]|nr:MAG: class I SAM-dependent DNA methyltransferase [Planctomycetota bacterium]REK30650.1 MAG: class I SAM-dependent DNA methyltransferase [Planctomycetota bacterium]REK33024.1 MAG: class I SAM-dependent DNA methyltransferase [Planctomycetota bacterium]
MTPAEFVERWSASGGAELANSQSFLKELCDLLDVPQPEPTQPDVEENRYVFEKAVTFNNGDGTTSSGRVDLYREKCFVLESKQGSERKAAEQAEALATKTKQKKRRTGTADRGTAGWDAAMAKARRQAEGYAKALPEWPPFLIVVDVGHCFDLYADFSGTGKLYQPFPDPRNYRIRLSELADETPADGEQTRGEQVREMLRTIWLDPQSLDPARRAAKVTRELAGRLAKLAKSLEEQTDAAGEKLHKPEDVAQFLMRCLFTMFAEDVELIPKHSFKTLLESLCETPEGFAPTVEALWREMDTGCDFSPILRAKLKEFNGGLFGTHTALPLNRDQLELLIEAAAAEWREVEPAIFGTLLERALDPHERHKLGAHYTPRAYVERLVMPTIIEPLREEWDAVYAAAVQEDLDGEPAKARKLVKQFHEQLCETRVLDPACGSGNFLYVSLELMKRLEGEVLNALREFGERQLPLHTIDPHQFLGIEVNPRAAAITDLVLWIGYLQWHFRTRGNAPLNEPIIRKFHNIECRDAVLAWDSVEPVTDEDGNPVTRWDGRTTKPHPVTGEEVPDETARVQELRYVNPRKAKWPDAEYILGNPPFVGAGRMRESLGSGYTSTLREVYDHLPESIDYVTYWWDCAVHALTRSTIRFGFVTTNSITQTFNRRVVASHLDSGQISIVFALPDHPWIDAATSAAVRIAMSVVQLGECDGRALSVVRDRERSDGESFVEIVEQRGRIGPRLRVGADVTRAVPLIAMRGVSSMGVKLHGKRFELSREEYEKFGASSPHVFPYLGGRDLTATRRERFVIDLFGLSAREAEDQCPAVYQHVLTFVKPHRDANNRATYRENWWIFGEPRTELRKAVTGLDKVIVTPRTAKHRFFQFESAESRFESEIVVVPSDDSFVLGILSSHPHVVWALAQGGRLGVGNDPRYNNSRCFETFPFPERSDGTGKLISALAERLDAHRKRQQELHPGLTMTGMYNVLEKLRSGETLTTKEQTIHEQGLVSVLKQIHDDLDAAVFDAYGWPHDLTDEQILERLVALNHERAEEESRGLVRWLRPEFQNPAGETQKRIATPDDAEAEAPAAKSTPVKVKKQPWPKTLPERVRVLRSTLAEGSTPLAADDLRKRFTRARKTDVEELLETLVEVGQARCTDDGRYVA